VIGPSELRIAEALSALDRGALLRLQRVLGDDNAEQRERIMLDLLKVPRSAGSELLGQLIALCDTDRAARLEVLRGIKDALNQPS
jgi:hypothetical protein